MKTFYVRPARDTGYGAGDGTSYDNAWNGMHSVDWQALAAAGPATLWVCGDPSGPPGFLTLYVETSYIEAAATRPLLGREPAESL